MVELGRTRQRMKSKGRNSHYAFSASAGSTRFDQAENSGIQREHRKADLVQKHAALIKATQEAVRHHLIKAGVRPSAGVSKPLVWRVHITLSYAGAELCSHACI